MKLLWIEWKFCQVGIPHFHHRLVTFGTGAVTQLDCATGGELAAVKFWCFRCKSFEQIKVSTTQSAFPNISKVFFPSLEAHELNVPHCCTKIPGWKLEWILVYSCWHDLEGALEKRNKLDRGHDLVNWRDLCIQMSTLLHNFGWLKSLNSGGGTKYFNYSIGLCCLEAHFGDNGIASLEV